MNNYPVIILSGLYTSEAKPEKPAWYENILQIINVLQGKWAYKMSLLTCVVSFSTRQLLTNPWYSVPTILPNDMTENIGKCKMKKSNLVAAFDKKKKKN